MQTQCSVHNNMFLAATYIDPWRAVSHPTCPTRTKDDACRFQAMADRDSKRYSSKEVFRRVLGPVTHNGTQDKEIDQRVQACVARTNVSSMEERSDETSYDRASLCTKVEVEETVHGLEETEIGPEECHVHVEI